MFDTLLSQLHTTPFELFVQALGFVAFTISISSYQFKSQRKMFGMRVCSDMVWTVHYFLLGALVPSLAVAIAFTRTFLVVFVIPQYKTYVIITAISAIFLMTLLTGPGYWANWLPAVSAIIYGFAFYFHEDYLKSRIFMGLGLMFWLTIGVVFGSVAEIVSSTVGLTSLLVGMHRHLRGIHPKP